MIPLACIPPFESICVMIITAFVSIPMALRATQTPAVVVSDSLVPKPNDNRFVAWCALYVLLVTLLLWAVLGIGLLVSAWHVY